MSAMRMENGKWQMAKGGDPALDTRVWGRTRRTRARAFILLEVMLAVGIFSIAVLALGNCMNNCLVAERLKEEDARATRFLLNRMSEIEMGSVVLEDTSTEKLKGYFDGMALKTTRVKLERKNEKDQNLLGLYSVLLALTWESDGKEQYRELTFYVYQAQQ